MRVSCLIAFKSTLDPEFSIPFQKSDLFSGQHVEYINILYESVPTVCFYRDSF
jgi:hypothetical protein